MDKRILFIVLAGFLWHGICLAKQNSTMVSDDFKPSSVNQPGKQFPQVNASCQL